MTRNVQVPARHLTKVRNPMALTEMIRSGCRELIAINGFAGVVLEVGSRQAGDEDATGSC